VIMPLSAWIGTGPELSFYTAESRESKCASAASARSELCSALVGRKSNTRSSKDPQKAIRDVGPLLTILAGVFAKPRIKYLINIL